MALKAASEALEAKRKEAWEANNGGSVGRSGRSRSPVGRAAAVPADGGLAEEVRRMKEQLARMERLVSSSASAPVDSSAAPSQRASSARAGRR